MSRCVHSNELLENGSGMAAEVALSVEVRVSGGGVEWKQQDGTDVQL